MSGWGSWLVGGGGAAKKKEAPKNAILQLRSTLEMLTKREKYLQVQIDEQDALARKYISTNKTAARNALKKKKALEEQLEQASAQMLTLDRQISSIETANINKETLDAMKNASAAMKQIHGGLTIEKVDATMEELSDQHAIAQEIADALTQRNAVGAVDEEELEDELAMLQQEELDNKMLKTGTIPVHDQVQRLPAVGTGPLPSSRTPKRVEEDDEEEELRKLQAEMAM